MAEFVEKRIEDMLPELEHMERIKLFDKSEVREIARMRKSFEYKIQRHTKSKEDYLKYIKYEMYLLKLLQQRREKYGIKHKKADIDFSITNKVNKLYIQAINRFKDDLRFWQAYMKFCKHVHFHRSMSTMIEQMLKTHGDKPNCWHIAARWEMKENDNTKNARRILLRGLHIHPTSQLLYTDAIQLELNEADSIKNETSTDSAEKSTAATDKCITRATVIYQAAAKLIRDVSFTISILNLTMEHENTVKLQKIIINDLIEKYNHEPKMWDTMARRELQGLTYDEDKDDDSMDTKETNSLRDRISACNGVYQSAVKKLKTEAMWSYYIDCLLEINQDLSALPNYKKKLLKTALMQAHQANKLREKYYLNWIEMMRNDSGNEKLYELLSNATDAIPTSVNLWREKMKYLIKSGQDDLIITEFNKAIKILAAEALPLWRMKLLYTQNKNPEKVEEIFRAAIHENEAISSVMKPIYIEWLVLTKGIQFTRHKYSELCVIPPTCLELHKKMAALEVSQPKICIQSARRPHETAAFQFGKSNKDVWIDYILFEMKHGDPLKVADIHRRAMKTLEAVLSDAFSSEYSLIKANPESIGVTS